MVIDVIINWVMLELVPLQLWKSILGHLKNFFLKEKKIDTENNFESYYST